MIFLTSVIYSMFFSLPSRTVHYPWMIRCPKEELLLVQVSSVVLFQAIHLTQKSVTVFFWCSDILVARSGSIPSISSYQLCILCVSYNFTFLSGPESGRTRYWFERTIPATSKNIKAHYTLKHPGKTPRLAFTDGQVSMRDAFVCINYSFYLIQTDCFLMLIIFHTSWFPENGK